MRRVDYSVDEVRKRALTPLPAPMRAGLDFIDLTARWSLFLEPSKGMDSGHAELALAER